MRILGVNAILHDPAAALVVDGVTIAAAEEERFTRRKHGKRPMPFSAWELLEQAMVWCLDQAGIDASDLDAVAYSYDPALVLPDGQDGLADPWDDLRARYAERAPVFMASVLPGLDPGIVHHVPHHVAHAASAALASPLGDCAVLVLDGRGEAVAHMAGQYKDGELQILGSQSLPHSLGLLSEHLGFLRPSDEYEVMALASDGTPRFADELRTPVRATGDGGFRTDPVDRAALTKPRRPGDQWTQSHAHLAASVQRRLEEVTRGVDEHASARRGRPVVHHRSTVGQTGGQGGPRLPARPLFADPVPSRLGPDVRGGDQ